MGALARDGNPTRQYGGVVFNAGTTQVSGFTVVDTAQKNQNRDASLGAGPNGNLPTSAHRCTHFTVARACTAALYVMSVSLTRAHCDVYWFVLCLCAVRRVWIATSSPWPS